MTESHADDNPPRRRRRGFFRWIADVFKFRRPSRDRDEPETMPQPAPASVTVSERRNSSEPLTVPADGGVFTFTVDYELIWTARGMSQATLAC